MLHKCHSLIFLLVIFNFVYSSGSDFENENSIPHFPPNPKEVEECKKDVLKCGYFSTYPRSLIEKLIKENAIKKEWFSGDKGVLTNHGLEYSKGGMKPLCKVRNQITYPQGKIDENGEFVYIVQMQLNNDYYYQEEKIEICEKENPNSNENLPCQVQRVEDGSWLNLTAEDFEFKCNQKYREGNMIGVTPNGTVVHVQYKINDYCACEYCELHQCPVPAV